MTMANIGCLAVFPMSSPLAYSIPDNAQNVGSSMPIFDSTTLRELHSAYDA